MSFRVERSCRFNMRVGDRITVSLPNEKQFRAIYIGDGSNNNLIRVKIESNYPRFGFINKKFVEVV